MNIGEFNTSKSFDYENGFYITSDISRIGKILTHYELYKMILDMPGSIVELGVFKGASLIRFATYRELFENANSRRIVGFDVFGDFPETEFENDKKFRENFVNAAGQGLSVEDINLCFKLKNIKNVELVKGNILETLPQYIEQNPQLKISLLHIDTDIYEPAKIALEYLYDRVVGGGVIIFDDYGRSPGETKAVDDFFADKKLKLKKFTFSQDIPVYTIKGF